MDDTSAKAAGGAIAVALLCGIGWFAYAQNKHELALINSGACEEAEEALYYPPPTYVCTSRNSDGVCMIQTPIPREPYMRTLWLCRVNGETETFWRRKVYD